MHTTPNPGQGRREYRIAVSSIAQAEALRDLLAANPLPANDYYAQALADAIALADEMDRNLQDVMDRFTPEQCGLA